MWLLLALLLPRPGPADAQPCPAACTDRYFSTPAAAGSATLAGDAKLKVAKDGTLNVGAGVAAAQASGCIRSTPAWVCFRRLQPPLACSRTRSLHSGPRRPRVPVAWPMMHHPGMCVRCFWQLEGHPRHRAQPAGQRTWPLATHTCRTAASPTALASYSLPVAGHSSRVQALTVGGTPRWWPFPSKGAQDEQPQAVTAAWAVVPKFFGEGGVRAVFGRLHPAPPGNAPRRLAFHESWASPPPVTCKSMRPGPGVRPSTVTARCSFQGRRVGGQQQHPPLSGPAFCLLLLFAAGR